MTSLMDSFYVLAAKQPVHESAEIAEKLGAVSRATQPYRIAVDPRFIEC